MLSAKNLIFEAKDIPETWVFANYCGIPLDQFNGSEFKIKSVFTNERTPSMGFFLKDGKYLFNDFSSGKKGDCFTLVKQLLGLNFHQTCTRIVDDYNRWRRSDTGDSAIPQYQPQSKYRVTGHEVRSWNVLDREYWLPYNIGSTLLSKYDVRPLGSYTMTREGQSMTITGEHIYGYFTPNGVLYKIYQPKTPQLKFIKVSDHIQGADQVRKRPFLVYASSLKDIMSLASLHLQIDIKAPDSENTLLPAAMIQEDLDIYSKILTLFDVDQAGQAAAAKYREKYGIQPVFLSYGEKDFSDHMKVFGPDKVIRWIVPLIDKIISA